MLIIVVDSSLPARYCVCHCFYLEVVDTTRQLEYDAAKLGLVLLQT
jgi:hypothetical protein